MVTLTGLIMRRTRFLAPEFTSTSDWICGCERIDLVGANTVEALNAESQLAQRN